MARQDERRRSVDDEEPGRWRDRRVLAEVLRAVLMAAPLVAAVVAVRLADSAFSPRSWAIWQELLLMVPLALAAGWATQRAVRRYLPLTMLLRMAVLFPGRAPSRYSVARQSRSRDQLMTLLADRDAGPQQAARAMMTLLAALAGHDRHTRGHSERTRVLADVLGAELELSQYDRDRLRWAALLHDVGKLEIARSILTKPSALNESEWERMRQHPLHGAELTSALSGWLGPWAAGIVHHHERFDGSGYPAGLMAEQISMAGRVIAVVDAYETMTAARAYQRPRSTVKARAELVRCAGTHFDPQVVRAFLNVSLPRLLWASGPLALVTHLPVLREMQAVGHQLASVSGASAATAAGVTAMTVSAAAVPAWTQTPSEVPPVAQVAASSSVGGALPDQGSATAGAGRDDLATATPSGWDDASQVAAAPSSPSLEVPEVVVVPPAAENKAAEVKAAKDEAAKDKAAKDKAAKDKAAEEKATKDKAAKDGAAKDGAAKDKAAKDKAAKDKAAKDKAAKDKAAKDEAAKDKAAKDKATKAKQRPPKK